MYVELINMLGQTQDDEFELDSVPKWIKAKGSKRNMNSLVLHSNIPEPIECNNEFIKQDAENIPETFAELQRNKGYEEGDMKYVKISLGEKISSAKSIKLL